MFKFFKRDKNKDTTKNEINQNPEVIAENIEPEVNIDNEIENKVETAVESKVESKPEKKGFFSRLYSGLAKTRKQLFGGLGGIGSLFTGKVNIDDELFEDLESHLLLADVGIEVTNEILEELTKEIKYKDSKDIENLKSTLKNKLYSILEPCEKNLDITKLEVNNSNAENKGPIVLLMVGVNGAGKTTTIGKLANQFKADGKSVMLAAGDTFRAAAIEQLVAWGERNSIPVVAQKSGSDSASVIFDAYESAKAKKVDILIADTAGRLHTQSNLMQELAKIKRVLNKQNIAAPHEVMLVLDAAMGQNALQQAKQFQQVVDVTGITLTKLDGTAKGGIIFAIARQLNIPIRYIGVGEGIEDLQPFNAKDFVTALID